MINNLKCDSCNFQDKCVARNKLKPFMATARTDLGVELSFVNCVDFLPLEDDGEFEDEDEG